MSKSFYTNSHIKSHQKHDQDHIGNNAIRSTLIAPEPSNKGKEEPISSTDIPSSDLSVVTNDGSSNGEEVYYNQLGDPEYYFEYYGHGK